MPWHVEHRDNEWCVIKDADDSNEGCHPSEAEAQAQMRALYANEPKAEGASGITFVDDAEVAASFKADTEKRIVQGLLVPWGRVARSGFAKWKFAPGSLHWSDPKRVKLNLGHERKDTVGVAVRLQTGAAGVVGTFKLARGEEGDRALSLAEDGVLDGFSVEVDFDDGDGWQPDPDDDSVRLVGRAALKGVALTGYPAFDDARVDRIAAARQKGTVMEKEKEQEASQKMESEEVTTFEKAMADVAAKVAESQIKFNESLSQSIGESISEGMKVALENIGDPQRGSVKAARYTVTREEPVYRFNGSGDSLCRDAWNAATAHDEDAIARLRKYRKQTEEVATLFQQSGSLSFAPQTTTSASNIIPPGYRPELYVPQLQQERPIVSSASQGVISNAAPFTVPVFGSSTSVSADHVEGTNPSDGSVAFATKTVTPQAISGRLVLTRELVDSSNPAIDQIALATMRESYNRQTEVKAYTLLNGANGAGGTITAGFVPSGSQAVTTAKGTDNQTLVKAIRVALAAYPFARFASPTAALMGAAATQLLAGAVDTTQRPLFPYIGATNSVGTGNSVTQGWQVDSLIFQGAWANTGVAAGDSQIMIIKASDFWVWESPLLSFRFEEKQGPANIELNIFGYFGTHLLRPVGLSGIRIT
jgi:HK97 family phage prohead protease